MSNAIRNVAETTAHAWSDLVDEARDLVDGAREKIEDLPQLARTRRRSSRKRWTLVAMVGLLGFMVLMVGKRRNRGKHDTGDSSAGARLTEKSLAVS